MRRYRKKKKGYTKEQDIFFGSILAIMILMAIMSLIIKYKTTIINILIILVTLTILGVIIYLVKNKNKKINIKNNEVNKQKTTQEIQEEIYQKQKNKLREEEEKEKYENVTFKKVNDEKIETEIEKNKGKEHLKIIEEIEKRFKKEEEKKKAEKETNAYKSSYKKSKNESNWTKGRNYEKQIGQLYEKKNYKVIYNGILKGKRDGGIDLIAENENEIILIQCKNWINTMVKQKDLKEFLGNCSLIIDKYKNKDKEVRYTYITSSKKIHKSVDMFLKTNPNIMEFIQIEYERAV